MAMSCGISKTLKTCLMTISAVSLAEGNLGSGINLHALENQSTTTRMVEFPWDVGSPVMKSI